MSINTVFVVGAGASSEVNLRTGLEFKRQIAQLLDIRYDDFGRRLEHGDDIIVSALHEHVRQPNASSININDYLQEAWRIIDALPLAISIDNFIDAHRDNDKIALCGKLAIVRSILDGEKSSLLYCDQAQNAKINFNSLEKTWYIPFFQLLTENCGKTDLKERFKSITLIIFNYDRCVEHFIYHALQNYYGLSVEEVIELVKDIDIFHPYGVVGALPWADQNGTRAFGDEPRPKKLLELSQKIKTFTEGTDPGASEVLEIRQHMRMANRVVFLGFAFHKLNMLLIAPEQVDGTSNPGIKCFATILGISNSDKAVVEEQIEELYPNGIKVNMVNKTCAEFFAEYWRSLSF